MKIAIDATRAVIEQAGIGRHTRELVKKLLEIDHKSEFLIFFSYFRRDPKKERIIESFKGPHLKTKFLKVPGNFKTKTWALALPWFERYLEKSNVLLAPSILEVNIGLKKIPQVVIIYDLTTFLFPEQRGEKVSQYLNKRTELVCKKAQKIIAISQSTQRDLVQILKIPKAKIEVIYPGLTELSSSAKKLPTGLKPKSYILFVGTIEPRKNLVGLFQAYSQLPPRLQEQFPLVVVGAEGWNTGETYQVLRKENLKDKVQFLGFTPDEILAKLYKEAAVFVYPSLYEGFGFPIIEAMQYGTPVITSNISSMPEVGGQAAILVDPQNPRAICRAIQNVLEGKIDISRLQKLSKVQAQKFSWQQNAKETLKILVEVAHA